jgi:FkbM family methyltransferase
MTFISYAQNLEDVMLWRALKHVENGFYIDVGANDPVIDSVTKAFYDRGWCGINIEPLLSHHADLAQNRPRDINLLCAAGSAVGQLDIWETDVRGWATADEEVITKYAAEGRGGAFHRVPLRTLKDICIEHCRSEIHFLKIDVEGFERHVLQGADLVKYRPWIILIEATKPNSTIEVYRDWESLILAAHYRFAYADGLNRFYVSDEHECLGQELVYPPNPFDNFIGAEQVNSEKRAQDAELRAQQAIDRAVSAESQTCQANERAASADARAKLAYEQADAAEAKANQACEIATTALAALEKKSTPRRRERVDQMKCYAVGFFKARPEALSLWAKSQIKLLLAHASLYINRRPNLRNATLALLDLFPNLKARVKLATLAKPPSQSAEFQVLKRLENLTPYGREIYLNLKDAVTQRSREGS